MIKLKQCDELSQPSLSSRSLLLRMRGSVLAHSARLCPLVAGVVTAPSLRLCRISLIVSYCISVIEEFVVSFLKKVNTKMLVH